MISTITTTILAIMAMFIVCMAMILMLVYFISLIEIFAGEVKLIKMLDRVFKGGDSIGE